MEMRIRTSLGIELEVNGDANAVAVELSKLGWCEGEQHSYHCGCQNCDFSTGLLWRYQRDSTVDGEFISRIFYDWASVRHATEVLGEALQVPNVAVGLNTGLHVHVGPGLVTWSDLVRAYLRWERWIQRLGAGPYADKREGMNCTVLDAAREVGEYTRSQRIPWHQAAVDARNRIMDDKHCDINYSQNYGTIEFRVFNSTMEPWQMELAARLAVAFCRFANVDYPDDESFVNPPSASRTLRPPREFDEFCAEMGAYDAELKALIERHLGREIQQPQPRPVVDTWSVRPRPRRSTPDLVWEPEPEPEPDDDLPSDVSDSVLTACGCASCIDMLAEGGLDRDGNPVPTATPQSAWLSDSYFNAVSPVRDAVSPGFIQYIGADGQTRFSATQPLEPEHAYVPDDEREPF